LKDEDIIKTKKELVVIRRHLIGAVSAIEETMKFYKPKCETCYKNFGYISKCICEDK
jgi:hypothetical protein